MKLVSLILVGLAALLLATPAQAGSYNVGSCGPTGYTGSAWKSSVSTPNIQATSIACDLIVTTVSNSSLMTTGDSGAWQLSVPQPLAITAIKRRMQASTYLNEWRAFAATENGEIDHCLAGDGSPGSSSIRCFWITQDTDPLSLAPPARSVRIGIRCVTSQCFAGDGVPSARVDVSDVSVTVSDPVAPSVSLSGVPATVPAGGSISSAVSGSDQTGISELQLVVDGRVVASSRRACDYSQALPCESPGATVSAQLSASGLAPGKHQVVGRALDAAGNVGSSDASPASPPSTVDVPAIPSPAPVPNTTPLPGNGLGIPLSGSGKALELKVASVRRSGSRVRVRGSVAAGCTGRLTVRVSVAGRSRTVHVKPSRSGRWGVWSSGLRRSGKISVRVSVSKSSACVAGAVRTSRR